MKLTDKMQPCGMAYKAAVSNMIDTRDSMLKRRNDALALAAKMSLELAGIDDRLAKVNAEEGLVLRRQRRALQQDIWDIGVSDIDFENKATDTIYGVLKKHHDDMKDLCSASRAEYDALLAAGKADEAKIQQDANAAISEIRDALKGNVYEKTSSADYGLLAEYRRM